MEAGLKLLKLFIIGEMIMDWSCNAFLQNFINKWQIRNGLHLTITLDIILTLAFIFTYLM